MYIFTFLCESYETKLTGTILKRHETVDSLPLALNSFTFVTEKMFLLKSCACLHLLFLGISIIIHTAFSIKWEYRWELYYVITRHPVSLQFKIPNSNPKKLNIFNPHSPLKISTEAPHACHFPSNSLRFLLYFLQCERGFTSTTLSACSGTEAKILCQNLMAL